MPEAPENEVAVDPIVTETVTVPAPMPDRITAEIAPEDLEKLEPAVDEVVLQELVNGVNSMNTMLEGGDPAADGGVLVLDGMQFGAVGIALALIVALLAVQLVLLMRR
jgi:hypothetical protein